MKSLAILAPLLLLAASPSNDRPNIIFIFADDIGISGFSCTGGQFKTPHVDALAKEGLLFENCFSMPLCGPSRAAVMTGRYGFRTGVVDNNTGGKATPQKETSVARALRQAGYATAVAGKWRQLQYLSTPEEARAWGFDEFMVWYDKKGGERYWDPHYNHNGKEVEGKGKYGPDLLHEFVVDFATRHKDRPFFVYYPMPHVHAPILRTPDTPEGQEKGKLLADNVAYMDKLVGKLAAEIDRLGLGEKTLIAFTGDNGSPGGGSVHNRRIDGGKGSLKEGGTRVPLVCRWKGTTPAGTVCKDLVDFTDFFATFADLAGAPQPEGVTLDSRSFAPQLKGQPGQPREWVYVQLRDQRYVRDARWKLYGDGAFCDLKEAPWREIPVAASGEDAEASAARRRLQAVLDRLR